jgi:uncharacterized membrane protein
MDKNRLEAFSDGVIAVIITIMVLELKVPSGTDLKALWPMIPGLLIYLLSFIYVGIYWVNHHHLFKATHRINGSVLWANLHLLFWFIPGTGHHCMERSHPVRGGALCAVWIRPVIVRDRLEDRPRRNHCV